MPRFYFHLHNGIGFTPDEEGQELPDLGAAHTFGIENIRSILKDDIDMGLIDLRGRIDVADEAGAVLTAIPFARAVELRLGSGRHD